MGARCLSPDFSYVPSVKGSICSNEITPMPTSGVSVEVVTLDDCTATVIKAPSRMATYLQHPRHSFSLFTSCDAQQTWVHWNNPLPYPFEAANRRNQPAAA